MCVRISQVQDVIRSIFELLGGPSALAARAAAAGPPGGTTTDRGDDSHAVGWSGGWDWGENDCGAYRICSKC